MANDLDGRLSTHRSDYEIHTPDNRDYRVNTKRPQSTAELVSSNYIDICYSAFLPSISRSNVYSWHHVACQIYF